jgi:hypothetical protein
MSDDTFEDERERLTEVLSEEDPPNVAVVSEPHAGRESLVDAAVETLGGAERVEFSSVAEAKERADSRALTDAENTRVVVEGCEYLYTRRIDGFGPLEMFVDAVAKSEEATVSSWNSYAWSYAEQATDTDDLFREVVRLPSVGVRGIADHLASEYDVSEFESDLQQLEEEEEAETVETWLFDRIPFDVWRLFYEESENFFERVTALSGGNPGVARAIFESRAWENKEDDEDETELSYEDAYVLRVVLSKETVERDVLEEVVEPRSLEKSLRRLSDSGFLEIDGGHVTLRPENLVNTVDHLERRNLVW